MQNLGIIGMASSGKTTVSQMVEVRDDYHRAALADPMKVSLGFLAHVQLDLPFPLHMSVTDTFGSVRRIMAGKMGYLYATNSPNLETYHRDIIVRDHFVNYVNAHKPHFRGALQQWGTEVIRGLAAPEEPWVKLLLQEAETSRFFGKAIVCDDVRYPHEVEQLRANGFHFVRIIRPDATKLTGEAANHSSEQFWSTLSADEEIVNGGSLDDLHCRVNDIVNCLKPIAF